MAENRAVWGIDIGQAGLKAVKLRYAESAGQVVAAAFDYVPHPKILSQPDAIPEELIPQALEKFLSRNDVKGDALAISVPGQTSLVKFIKLPPVESSKVAEIVKYEARQQIPFALEDVIWDFQPVSVGMEEGGYMLDAEVGLFAMKRDQVMQHLKPFTDKKVEIELIQTAPLALYNLLRYDYLGRRPGDEQVDSNDHYIVVDMGADNTTLLVSNGENIWIRNVPIGGNHFTRALTKEMKLTFAKAEHLKCNATKSPDPRAVFQALRPVFNDYVAEIQRSIGYFSSVNRDAKISKVLGLGNGFRLAGLQKFLQQNLQYEVERVETFQGCVGDSVLSAPLFQENIMSFGVAYGLALQAADVTRIKTTLLPPEIAMARKIRRKKPWAVTTAAALLAMLATSAAGYSHVKSTVSEERWKDAEGKVGGLQSEISGYRSNYDNSKNENSTIKENGRRLMGNLETREYWPEIYKAINECLPRDVANQMDEKNIMLQHKMKITSISAKKEASLAKWFNSLPSSSKNAYMAAADRTTPPGGSGYVFTLQGTHYHHNPTVSTERNALYVKNFFLKNLQEWIVQQPGSAPQAVGKLGISHALIVTCEPDAWFKYDPSFKLDSRSKLPGSTGPAGGPGGSGFPGGSEGYGDESGYPGGAEGYPGGSDAGFPGGSADFGSDEGSEYGSEPGGYPGGEGGYPGSGGSSGVPGAGPSIDLEKLAAEDKEYLDVPKTDFVVQFIWKPTPIGERLDERPEAGAADGDGQDQAF